MRSSIFGAEGKRSPSLVCRLTDSEVEDRPLACQGRQPSRLSKIGTTGWKPVCHDRRNACLPAAVAWIEQFGAETLWIQAARPSHPIQVL